MTPFQNCKNNKQNEDNFLSTILFAQVQQKLGYCPQFDALIEQMTVRETLAMFARLRGIDEKQIPRVVVMLVTNLLLLDHIDKQCGDLRWVNVPVYICRLIRKMLTKWRIHDNGT